MFIGSITEDNKTPYYAEKCTTTLGVTYSSGMTPQRKITTTDLKWNSQGCARTRGGLTGTSASAPMAAGMIALMLDARYIRMYICAYVNMYMLVCQYVMFHSFAHIPYFMGCKLQF